jgi:hypothetical protein
MVEKAHATTAEVRASEGEVLVKGPGGIVYAFTPEAAAETSDRLFDGAAIALGQKAEKARRNKRPTD